MNSMKSFLFADEPLVKVHTKFGDVDVDPTRVKHIGFTEVEFKCFRPSGRGGQLTKTYKHPDKIDTDVYKTYTGVASVTVIYKDDTEKKFMWQVQDEPHPETIANKYMNELRTRVFEIQDRSIYERMFRKFWRLACVVAGVLTTISLIIIKGKLNVNKPRRF